MRRKRRSPRDVCLQCPVVRNASPRGRNHASIPRHRLAVSPPVPLVGLDSDRKGPRAVESPMGVVDLRP